jgi:hypothetical protein
MKKKDVEIGGTYIAKVSDKLTRVRIDGEAGRGWYGTNLRTRRQVRILSARRLRRRVDEPAEQSANERRGDAALPTTVAHVETQTTGQEGDGKMAKQQSKKTGTKKKAEAPAAKDTYPVAGGDRDWTCKACGRTIRMPAGQGRCECGQAWLIRGGKRLMKVVEQPRGCAKNIPLAETVAEPPAEEPKAAKRPAKKRERADGKMSGLDAAAQVLAEAAEPLGAKTMVERMLEKGLWATSGKTPAATIYAAIIREIAKKGDASRFVKAERGKFTVAK